MPMIKRRLFALALVLAALSFADRPAEAIPPGPTLLVIAYYADAAKTQLIGQAWSGCNRPSGSWGTTSGINNVFFTPC
jgi:Family of unknown function (DUF6289)